MRAVLIGVSLLVARAAGHRRDRSREPLMLLLAVALALVLFASLGVIVGIYAESWDHTAFVNNLAILPLTFLGGVFYSVDSLPSPWQEISHVNPIFFLVQAVRYGFLGTSDVSVWVALAVTGGAGGRVRRLVDLAVRDRPQAQAVVPRRVPPIVLVAGRGHVDPVRRRDRGHALRRRRLGRRLRAAPRLRRARPPRRVAPAPARLRARGPAPRRRVRPRARPHELHVLRGARPHPARHRGDDRVHRARWRSRSSGRGRGSTCCGSSWRGRASSCSPTRAARARRTPSASCSRSPRRCAGASTSCSPRAPASASPAAAAWRSR